MQFNAKLKLQHLMEIITLQQTSTNIEKDELEVPIQLGIIDDLNPYAYRKKVGIAQNYLEEDLKKSPVTLSLFTEYHELQDEKQTYDDAYNNYFQAMLEEMGG